MSNADKQMVNFTTRSQLAWIPPVTQLPARYQYHGLSQSQGTRMPLEYFQRAVRQTIIVISHFFHGVNRASNLQRIFLIPNPRRKIKRLIVGNHEPQREILEQKKWKHLHEREVDFSGGLKVLPPVAQAHMCVVPCPEGTCEHEKDCPQARGRSDWSA